MKTIHARLKKLEEKAGARECIYALWEQDEPEVYRVNGRAFPSLEAIEAEYPDKDVVCFRIVWEESQTQPGAKDITISWEDENEQLE